MGQVNWKKIAQNLVVGSVYEARVPGGWLYATINGLVFVPITEVNFDDQQAQYNGSGSGQSGDYTSDYDIPPLHETVILRDPVTGEIDENCG